MRDFLCQRDAEKGNVFSGCYALRRAGCASVSMLASGKMAGHLTEARRKEEILPLLMVCQEFGSMMRISITEA